MQSALPSQYGFKLRQQFIFKDFSALFSELHQNKQIPEWWRDDVLTNHVIVFSGVTVGILAMAVGALTGGAITLAAASGGGVSGLFSIGRVISKDADAVTLMQTALMILLHERLCWLGIQEINSKEFLARAAVDVLKMSTEINADIRRQFGWRKDDWEDILFNVISDFRERTVFV